VQKVQEVNMMEEPLSNESGHDGLLPLVDSGGDMSPVTVSLRFRPYEVKTVLVTLPTGEFEAGGAGTKRRRRG
jgi:hypothetical protein